MPDGVNKFTNPQKRCKETFANQSLSPASVKLPRDPVVQLYFVGLAAIGVYTLARLMQK